MYHMVFERLTNGLRTVIYQTVILFKIVCWSIFCNFDGYYLGAAM